MGWLVKLWSANYRSYSGRGWAAIYCLRWRQILALMCRLYVRMDRQLFQFHDYPSTRAGQYGNQKFQRSDSWVRTQSPLFIHALHTLQASVCLSEKWRKLRKSPHGALKEKIHVKGLNTGPGTQRSVSSANTDMCVWEHVYKIWIDINNVCTFVFLFLLLHSVVRRVQYPKLNCYRILNDNRMILTIIVLKNI